MKRFMIFAILLIIFNISACINNEPYLKSKHKTITIRSGIIDNHFCKFNGPAIVNNVNVFGSQNYMGVNNFRLFKTSSGKLNKIDKKNSLLPSLALQFVGIIGGSDVLTNGGKSDDLIIEFKPSSFKMPVVLNKNESIVLALYEQTIAEADGLKVWCEFYWDDV